MSILVLEPTPEDFDERVRAVAPDAAVTHAHEQARAGSGARAGESELEAALERAEILLGRPTEENLAKAARLKWIQLPSAGANSYVGRIPAHILLTSANGVYGVPASEHVFALMLAVARAIPQYVRNQAEPRWDREGSFVELYGSTCGVLGLGDIGLAVAERARAFGMRVIGSRRTKGNPPPGLEEVFAPGDLERMLAQCDFVVNTLPETPATRGLLDRSKLRAMKQGAVVVNVGRGTTIDEAALVEALQDGHLGGAGLDVFEEEPLPGASALWSMPNVIITPHVGGSSPRGDERVAELFLDNLRRYREGRTLRNLVDRELGY